MGFFQRETTFKIHLTKTEFYSRLNEFADTSGDFSLNPFKKSPYKYVGEIEEGAFSFQLNSQYENRDDYDKMFSPFCSTRGHFEEKEDVILVHSITEIRPGLKLYFSIMTVLTVLLMIAVTKGGWIMALFTISIILGMLYWSVRSAYWRWFEDFAMYFRKEKTAHNNRD